MRQCIYFLRFFSNPSMFFRAFTLLRRYTRSELNITTPLLRRECSLAKSGWLSNPSSASACRSRGSILSFAQSVPESRARWTSPKSCSIRPREQSPIASHYPSSPAGQLF